MVHGNCCPFVRCGVPTVVGKRASVYFCKIIAFELDSLFVCSTLYAYTFIVVAGAVDVSVLFEIIKSLRVSLSVQHPPEKNSRNICYTTSSLLWILFHGLMGIIIDDSICV